MAGGEELLVPGVSVRLTGLKSAETLNGTRGKIVGKEPSSNRWRVELLEGPERGCIKALRSENLDAGAGFGSASSSTASAARRRRRPLAVGAHVRLCDLETRRELNGLAGVILAKVEKRWHVRLDKDQSEKLMKGKNLELLPTANGALKTRFVPGQVEVQMVGSWDSWAPQPMTWDPERRCYQANVTLGERGWESFLLLLDSDWFRCLHPDRANACPYVEHKLCGPDDAGTGKSWTIGKHPKDGGLPGALYEVQLMMEGGHFTKVTWVLLYTPTVVPAAAKRHTPPAAVPVTPSPAKAVQPARAQRPLRPPPTLRSVLQAAKPDWTQKDLLNVEEKLGKAQVSTSQQLLEALQGRAYGVLNEKLKAAGQKTFAADTLKTLKEKVQEMMEDPSEEVLDAPKALMEKPLPGGKMKTYAQIVGIDTNPQLPKQRFEVLNDMAMVRSAPSLLAAATDRKDKGDFITAFEETFDGFVHLDEEPGWITKDMRGLFGLGRLLEPVGRAPLVAADYLAGESGPQKFEVVFKPAVAVRASPSTAATIVGVKTYGELVSAVTQTYHGWVRLAEDAGWMLSFHPEHGQLLKPTFEPAPPPMYLQEEPEEDMDEMIRRVQAEVMERRGGAPYRPPPRPQQGPRRDDGRPTPIPVGPPQSKASREREAAMRKKAAEEAARAKYIEEKRRAVEAERRQQRG